MMINSTRQFARNASALSFTSALRILLNLALRFAILRWLGVNGFGQYASFGAYTAVFQVVAELGLPRLIIRDAACQRDQVSAYWRAALLAQAGGALLSALIMAGLAVSPGYSPETTALLLMGAISLLPYTIQSVTEACCQALERMEFIPLVQGLAMALQVGGSVAILALGQGVIGLGIIALAAQGFTALFYLVIAHRLGLLSKNPEAGSVIRQAIGLVRLSYDFFALSVSNVTFSKLDTLLLSRLLGDGPTGVYNTAFLIVQVLNLLAVGYTDALYPRLARLYTQTNRVQFSATINQALRFGLLVLIPAVLALSVLAAPVVSILYQGSLRPVHAEQMQAATALRILSWFALPFLINAILGGALMASGHQRASLQVSLIKLVAAAVFYLAGIHFFGIIGASVATLLTGLTAIGLNWIYVTRALGTVHWQQLLIKPAASSLIMGLAMTMLSWPLGNGGWMLPMLKMHDLAVAILTGLVIYPIALTAMRGLTDADRSLFRALFSRQPHVEKVIQP